MAHETERELMRLLHGELSQVASEHLQQRMRREQRLQEAYDNLRQRWSSLQLPTPAAAPPGFARRVLSRARDAAQEGWGPIWWYRSFAGRIATAAVLVGGIVFGTMLALPADTEAWVDYAATESTMADSYLAVLEEPELEAGQEGQP